VSGSRLAAASTRDPQDRHRSSGEPRT